MLPRRRLLRLVQDRAAATRSVPASATTGIRTIRHGRPLRELVTCPSKHSHVKRQRGQRIRGALRYARQTDGPSSSRTWLPLPSAAGRARRPKFQPSSRTASDSSPPRSDPAGQFPEYQLVRRFGHGRFTAWPSSSRSLLGVDPAEPSSNEINDAGSAAIPCCIYFLKQHEPHCRAGFHPQDPGRLTIPGFGAEQREPSLAGHSKWANIKHKKGGPTDRFQAGQDLHAPHPARSPCRHGWRGAIRPMNPALRLAIDKVD
jgi:hypothetical protein